VLRLFAFLSHVLSRTVCEGVHGFKSPFSFTVDKVTNLRIFPDWDDVLFLGLLDIVLENVELKKRYIFSQGTLC